MENKYRIDAAEKKTSWQDITRDPLDEQIMFLSAVVKSTKLGNSETALFGNQSRTPH